MIRAAFHSAAEDAEHAPRQLVKRLEAVFRAPRLDWPGPQIRVLWDSLWDVSEERQRSAEHEAAWINLSGILLRPGFGDPLDSDRIARLWDVFRQGVIHADALWCRIGWWILWRRVSGGLERGQQLELTNKLSQPLLTGAAIKALAGGAKTGGKAGKAGGKKGQKGSAKSAKEKTQGHGQRTSRWYESAEVAEMWRAAASLERTPATSKGRLG